MTTATKFALVDLSGSEDHSAVSFHSKPNKNLSSKNSSIDHGNSQDSKLKIIRNKSSKDMFKTHV